LLIRSAVPLDLPTSTDVRWDVDVRWGPDLVESQGLPPGEIIAEYVSGGANWYTATATPSSYVLRFRDCGEFVVSHDLSEILVRRDPNGRHELMPILLAGTATAFLLTLRGRTVLHASAVAVGGRALAFVGQSGRGKSTMAALMCLGGAGLVTDDVLAVDAGPPVMCIGGAAELRLRDAAAHLAEVEPDSPGRMTVDERRAFAPRLAPPGPLPLGAIVIPSPSRTHTEVDVRRLSVSDATFAMLSFPRIHGWRRTDILTREFQTLARVANQVPVYDAAIPWGPQFDRHMTAVFEALLRPEADSA
jgi:hypothetical protein